MAQITISASLDMHSVSTWDGLIAAYDSSRIVVVNGPLSGTYSGSFRYDDQGNVFGTLTGLTETFSGQTLFSITGLGVSATQAEQLILAGQVQTFLSVALSGDDQFTLQPGTHVIDGYGGHNVVTEPSAYASYTLSSTGSSVVVSGAASYDTLVNIQEVRFADGTYNAQTRSFSSTSAPAGSGFAAFNTTAGHTASGPVAHAYAGPVPGLRSEYINVTADSLNITVSSDGWFIHSGAGTDAITAHGGTNVLDGGTGSNFLTGGSGTDTFFVDDRGPSSDIWSTVNSFHTGDSATIWGVTSQDFTLSWADGQGAAGYTGLTLHASAPGRATASLTLAGYGTADLDNGRLSVSFGTDAASGSAYMYVHANA